MRPLATNRWVMGKSKINSGHYHEAMHACCILESTFEEWIYNSPAVKKHPKLRAKADAILHHMGNLYQEIGCADPNWSKS